MLIADAPVAAPTCCTQEGLNMRSLHEAYVCVGCNHNVQVQGAIERQKVLKLGSQPVDVVAAHA
jgi:hypothetical protein